MQACQGVSEEREDKERPANKATQPEETLFYPVLSSGIAPIVLPTADNANEHDNAHESEPGTCTRERTHAHSFQS